MVITMCHSGLCRYESLSGYSLPGDCSLTSKQLDEIKTKFGISPCEIPSCKEEEDWMNENKQLLQEIYKFITEGDK